MQKRPWHLSQRGARCVRAAPSTCKDQRGQPGISHRLRMVSDGVEMRDGCAHACCSGCACLSQNRALHCGHAMGRKESVPHVGRAQCSPSMRDMRQCVWRCAKTVHFTTMHWIAIWGMAMLSTQAAYAQFFQHLFHQDGFGSFFQQDQEPEAHNVGDASWFQDRVQHAQCGSYLCSDTLACVETPDECPCPYKEQQRCAVGDTYVCVQGQDCGRISSMYQLQ